MVGFHRITDIFVWFNCIFSLQVPGPVMLGTGSPVPGTGGTMVTVPRVGLWTPTPIVMTNEGGNEMNDLEKRKR